MATNYSNRRMLQVPSWRQKNVSSGPIDVQNDANSSSHLNEKSKRISYEKEYFVQMLKNIENDSKTTKTMILNNARNVGHGCPTTLCKNTNERSQCLDNKKVNNKDCRHFIRHGLNLQTSEDMVGVVDKIIETSKDPRTTNASTLSLATNNTNDAGEMLSYLLNKTYPNSFQGRGRQKSASPTRKDTYSNGYKQKEPQSHRPAWTYTKNNNIKEKSTR